MLRIPAPHIAKRFGRRWKGIQVEPSIPYGDGSSLLHAIEPKVIYEFVPGSSQGDIVQVDAVDDLPKKNLITYSLNNRVFQQSLEARPVGWILCWRKATIPESTPTQTRDFFFTGSLYWIV